jgi:hypothetical protein
MDKTTRFILDLSALFMCNSLIDFLFDKPLNHTFNFGIALVVASIFAYMRSRDTEEEEEDS